MHTHMNILVCVLDNWLFQSVDSRGNGIATFWWKVSILWFLWRLVLEFGIHRWLFFFILFVVSFCSQSNLLCFTETYLNIVFFRSVASRCLLELLLEDFSQTFIWKGMYDELIDDKLAEYKQSIRVSHLNLSLRRWCFDVELVFLCKRFNIPMLEISVNWSEIPGSKVNMLSIPNMLWELALMSVGYRTGMWKIHNAWRHIINNIHIVFPLGEKQISRSI